MSDNSHYIKRLLSRVDILVKKQDVLNQELLLLKEEIYRLKKAEDEATTIETSPGSIPEKIEETIIKAPELISPATTTATDLSAPIHESKEFKLKVDLEKFIGENIINKIGIIITVIGVAIGAKYSIDNELISPLTRIILGYLAGIVLLILGIKLKKNYLNYSSVLVSGALAILYFITYFAYSFYSLIPQSISFGLMVIFTSFGVLAAIKYNKQVIALIGLVGAYAVPFLLGDDSGNVTILFGYMALINVGILLIAFLRYWNLVYYAAFLLTWIIYSLWFVNDYTNPSHFNVALIFVTVFFIIFYLTILSYKLIKKQQFEKRDVIFLLSNSFLFYGYGFSILADSTSGRELVGLFTLVNALIHFIPSMVIYRQKLADRNLFYLTSGLVLVFLTIAVPAELSGKWITLLWAGEAALLYWIGNTKNISFYEKLSIPLMVLAFISQSIDWNNAYHAYVPSEVSTRVTPFLNTGFLSSLLFCVSFGWINYLKSKKSQSLTATATKNLYSLIRLIITGILLWALYCTFRMEIEIYWQQLFLDSRISINPGGENFPETHTNTNLLHIKTIWILNYSLLFLSILSFVNIKFLKNKFFGHFNLLLNTIALASVVTLGISALGSLRESYINQSLAAYYNIGSSQFSLRYIVVGLVVLLLYYSFQYLKHGIVDKKFTWLFDLVMHGVLLSLASSELIHWLELAKSTQSDKIGLSILWGVYALILIILGIWKKMKHLRIGAIVLFSTTLIKLFTYDIADLNTIAKTIVFVSLGILLLIISFLYNKYKHIIDEK